MAAKTFDQLYAFMTPDVISFNIGQTVYGQDITLTRAKDSANNVVWTIRREAAGQRDDTAVITGLTRDHLTKIAEAVQSTRP